ncbi:hypothetical protein niasHS_005992 [Heterodera schachtii]|uniref:Uncharacterized protein n=1 Tax=Heterodera schachtii TaxID=97005 RepID=A0ABD2JN45_HETSC
MKRWKVATALQRPKGLCNQTKTEGSVAFWNNHYWRCPSCMNELDRMRAFNSVALVGSGVLFALTGFVPKEMPFLAVILMTLNFAVVSTNCGGFYKCATLISRQFAHFVVAGIQFEKSVTLFISPLIFLLFIKDESSQEQWRNVFLGMSVVLLVANIFFWFLADDQPAEFTKEIMKIRKQNHHNNLEAPPKLASAEKAKDGGEQMGENELNNIGWRTSKIN